MEELGDLLERVLEANGFGRGYDLDEQMESGVQPGSAGRGSSVCIDSDDEESDEEAMCRVFGEEIAPPRPVHGRAIVQPLLIGRSDTEEPRPPKADASKGRGRVIVSDSESESDSEGDDQVPPRGGEPVGERSPSPPPRPGRPYRVPPNTPREDPTDLIPVVRTSKEGGPSAMRERLKRMARAAADNRPPESEEASTAVRLAKFFPDNDGEAEDGRGENPTAPCSDDADDGTALDRKRRMAQMARRVRAVTASLRREDDDTLTGLEGAAAPSTGPHCDPSESSEVYAVDVDLDSPDNPSLASELALTRRLVELYVQQGAFMAAVGELSNARPEVIEAFLNSTASQVAVVDVTITRASTILDGVDAARDGTDYDSISQAQGHTIKLARQVRESFQAALLGYLVLFVTFLATDDLTNWYMGECKNHRSTFSSSHRRSVPIPTQEQAVRSARCLCKVALALCPTVAADSREAHLAERLSTLELS